MKAFLIPIVVLCLVSCKEDEGQGGVGQDCYPNGTCDEGLVCVDSTCVRESADAETDDDAEGDAPPDGPCRNNADCSNGLVCDGEEECIDGECMPGEDLDCNDGDPCTMDDCDEDEGGCVNEPLDADGDGYIAEYSPEPEHKPCGGTDCLDNIAEAYPGHSMVECSTLDHDCNGNADEDNDGDGHVWYRCEGGDDCDDTSADIVQGECSGVNDCCDGCWQINGCWRDDITGYLWEDPRMGGYQSWNDAIAYCNAFSLADHGPGEWELPSISTLRTLIRGCPDTEDGGTCGVTDTCLDESCYIEEHCIGCDGTGPGAGGCYWDPALEEEEGEIYWSSSPTDEPVHVWIVDFNVGSLDVGSMGGTSAVRCVHLVP